MADPVVSVLIVTWKRIDLLEECLHGIAAAKPDVPFEIVIVNNGGARTAARVDASFSTFSSSVIFVPSRAISSARVALKLSSFALSTSRSRNA